MFITFEGIDYSGKSTQANLLADHLRHSGRPVLLLREPGGTPISEKIRGILLDGDHNEMYETTELLLFAAARSQLVAEVILPALEEGMIVICDRFYDSTTAYQGYGRGLDLDAVGAINRLAAAGTKPDLTLFIDVGFDEILRRRKSAEQKTDRMESAGREFYERVMLGYRAIARNEPDRWHTIDGTQNVEAIHTTILSILSSRIP